MQSHDLLIAAGQILTAVLLAPLLQGSIQRCKAVWQGRHGPGVLQPYYNLRKLLGKSMPIPQSASYIFHLVPLSSLAVMLTTATLVPLLGRSAPFGDFLLVVYLLALERFGLALAGFDGGTPFGGLGSSREMTVAALVEPSLLGTALPWILAAGGTAWPALISASWHAPPFGVIRFLGGAAMLVVLLAETGRLPVDNPDTHLELTMIHEAMELEYSGPYLAFLQLAQMVKQLVIVSMAVDLFLPWGGGSLHVPLTLLKWAGVAVLLATVESVSAKLRFSRLPAYLGAAGALAAVATVLQIMGVH